MSRSDYIREAVREKKKCIPSERIGELSRCLAAEHMEFYQSIEASINDGLAEDVIGPTQSRTPTSSP